MNVPTTNTEDQAGSKAWKTAGPERAQGPHTNWAQGSTARLQRLRNRDESDPDRSAVELAQRGQIILDVAAADLEAAEITLGPFHPTTWHFRTELDEARRSWERLRAELGTTFVETALKYPPVTVMTLGEHLHNRTRVELVLIAGQTYRTQEIAGTVLAPVQWRLTRLNPPLDHGPYYVCRLADGSTQCDCADWTYRIAETDQAHTAGCKHVVALTGLGWI